MAKLRVINTHSKEIAKLQKQTNKKQTNISITEYMIALLAVSLKLSQNQ